jgi:hypothetical protein
MTSIAQIPESGATLATLDLSNQPQSSIQVNFSNRGLAKVIKFEDSLEQNTIDRATIVEVGNLLSNVEIVKGQPTGFKSIPEFVGADYVGYIIEKERLGKNGKWIRVDEYRIIGSAAAGFKDSRVAYGNVYRYRIKSVVKITFKISKKSHENLELVENIRQFEKEQIREQIGARKETIANIEKVTNLGISRKSSTGREPTVYDLLSGFKITADEQRSGVTRISAGSKDPERDLRRAKNLRVQDLEVMRGSISSEQLQKQINNILSSIQEEVFEYRSYYYEGKPSKSWQIVEITENIPPPPPSAIKVVPNSTKGTICVSWLPPANSQRDIKQFKFYHRNELGRPWQILEVFDIRDTVFEREYDLNKKHIFAISSLDVHGMESFLSTQIQAEFNPNYKIEKKEKLLKWVSGSGAKISEVNAVFKRFLETEDPIVAKRSVEISPTPFFGETSKNLLIRVTSLDTHEQKEYNLTITNTNLGKTVGDRDRLGIK